MKTNFAIDDSKALVEDRVIYQSGKGEKIILDFLQTIKFFNLEVKNLKLGNTNNESETGTNYPMLLLLFYLGEERYVLDSDRLVEIIPQVNLRPVYQVPEYVAGVLNYRGKVVPVVDLGLLIQGNPCRRCLSTRTIVVNYPLVNGKTHYLGLIAERVTDMLNPSSQEFTSKAEFSLSTAYLGEMLVDRQGMIGRLQLENLFSEAQQQWFLPENRSE